VKIATKKQAEIGEEGWFIILEFLSDYSSSISERYEKLSLSGGLSGKQV